MLETITVEALGYAWEITDARRYNDQGQYRRVALVRPLDIETGERVTELKIGRCERSYHYPPRFTANGAFYHEQEPSASIRTSGYALTESLTDRAEKMLNDALRLHLLPFLAELTSEEVKTQYLADVRSRAESATAGAIREAEYTGGPMMNARGQIATAAEVREAIAAGAREAFKDAGVEL